MGPLIGGSSEGESGDQYDLFEGAPWKEGRHDGPREVSEFDPFHGEQPWLASLWEEDSGDASEPGTVLGSGQSRECNVQAYETVECVLDAFHELYGNLLDPYAMERLIRQTEENSDLPDPVLDEIGYEQGLARALALVLLQWPPQDIVAYSEEISGSMG